VELSIVATLYHSASFLDEFYARVCAAAKEITDDFEIILVNDGSPDDSLDIAISLYEKDKRVRVIDLSRNFGHHKAIMTGLAYARGKLTFLIDCDLEEEPEWLGLFHTEMKVTGADVVYGIQQTRKGNFFERVTGALFFWLFNILSSYPIPSNLITVRLMSQRYVSSLVEHKDREIFLAGLWAITGFKQIPLVVKKRSREGSTYDLRRKLSVLTNSITSFSIKPLIFIFYLGCGISFVSSIAALYLIMRRIFLSSFLGGWPSLIVSVWFLGGLTLFCLGVIGIYLAKIFMETKPRPYTVIRRFYEYTEQAERQAR
jgi:putative glycosyltransferase